MASELTPEERAQIDKAYLKLDGNRDGKITLQELETALPLIFPNKTDAEYQSIADEFGLDGSGTIKYEKFVEKAAIKIKKDKELK